MKREKTTLRAGAGPGFVLERRKNIPPLETAAVFGFVDFDHTFRGGDSFRADFWATTYVEETQRTPMRLELRYSHPLRNHFDLSLQFILDYVPEPPDPAIKSYDTKFVVGLSWKP